MSRPAPSLLHRVMASQLILTALSIVLTIAALNYGFTYSIDVLQDRGLLELAETVLHHTSKNKDGTVSLDLPPETAREFAGHEKAFSIVNIDGKVIYASQHELKELLHPFSPHMGGRIEYFQHLDPNEGEPYYGINLQRVIDGTPFWIQLTVEVEDEGAMNNSARSILLTATLIIVPAILFVTLLLAAWRVRQLFQPLRRVASDANQITPDNTRIQLDATDLPTEVLPLVDAVNLALGRMEKALTAQRQFSADAAHELLTPIAVMRANVDSMEKSKEMTGLKQELDDMSDVVAQLLDAAKLEATQIAMAEVVDLHAICVDVLGTLAPLAIRQDKNLALTGIARAVGVKGDGVLLRRIVRNLVDNAISHTEAGGDITVELLEQNSGVLIKVMDDGRGINDEDKQKVFERFWRGDRRRQSSSGGLGLSIVLRAVQAHNGSIHIEDRPGGGTVFVVDLPRAIPG